MLMRVKQSKLDQHEPVEDGTVRSQCCHGQYNAFTSSIVVRLDFVA